MLKDREEIKFFGNINVAFGLDRDDLKICGQGAFFNGGIEPVNLLGPSFGFFVNKGGKVVFSFKHKHWLTIFRVFV